MIPIFNVVLKSDKDENVINNGKHFVLFLLSKYSDKLYANIVFRTQIEMINFIQVQASIAFAAISEFWFSEFAGFTICKLKTIVIALLIAFLIKINNKKLDQVISKLQSYFVFQYFWKSLEGIYIIIDNSCKPLKIFQQIDVY